MSLSRHRLAAWLFEGFRIPGRDLAPGWRWMMWGAGALIVGIPFLLRVVLVGRLSWGDAFHAVLLGLPGLAAYLLLLCSKRRGEMFAMICVVGLGAGLLSGGGGIPIWSGGMGCRRNLEKVRVALSRYRERTGTYPTAFGKAYLLSLQQSGDCPDPGGFRCAKLRGLCDFVPNPALAGQGPEAYEVANPSATPWVWEEEPVDHRWDPGFFSKPVLTRMVLFLDGDIRLMQEADFQAMLAKGSR